ncbi:hypothetical protein F3Y22_tig00111095pilonHSYRG00084 [Hibiscus syriacus]|uniref:Reverse transcriptase zinc-binding domain-containing protein n=1 Tax=Hibiscus syriacus TaxID=106335 RepID=A0A6A2Z3B8_HIBSY|nr:hypothetical protein F3Y22_tig00111095pilonHSYRG00084 [Hibiscus syriacus]
MTANPSSSPKPSSNTSMRFGPMPPSILPSHPRQCADARIWVAYIDEKVLLGPCTDISGDRRDGGCQKGAIAELEEAVVTMEGCLRELSKGKAFFSGITLATWTSHSVHSFSGSKSLASFMGEAALQRQDARCVFLLLLNLNGRKVEKVDKLDSLIKLREEARRLFWPATNLTQIKAWMVILDRLATKDRLVRFGMMTDNICGLCDVGQESQNHLFLEYSFAKEVWGAILRACGLQLQILHCWNDALRWLTSNLKGKSLLF